MLQYDGSKDDLDWRIDFEHPNIWFIKKIKIINIEYLFTAWNYLFFFIIQIDFIRILFFEVQTLLIRISKKFYTIQKKKKN